MKMQYFNGAQYLKIDVANNFGHDKLKWDERIEWFNENEHRLDSLVEEAAEPTMFFAGVNAYKTAKAGKPIRYGIGLDATASGLQIFSCLTNCLTSAKLCNVVNTGNREDAYLNIYNRMIEKLGDKGDRIDRKELKRAVNR